MVANLKMQPPPAPTSFVTELVYKSFNFRSQLIMALEQFNVLISRLKLEKPTISYHELPGERWKGTVDFMGSVFESNGRNKKGVEGDLCQEMIQLIHELGLYRAKKKKRYNVIFVDGERGPPLLAAISGCCFTLGFLETEAPDLTGPMTTGLTH